MPGFIDNMVVEDRGNGFRCYAHTVWEEGGNKRGEYWFDDTGWHVIPHDEGFPAVTSKEVTIAGKKFEIGTFGASAVGLYRPRNLLIVAAADHTLKFFDVAGATPTLVKSFGQPGGIMAGEPGVVTPTKFWSIAGVGSDGAGNLYVAMSELGVAIRRFAVVDAQALTWNETTPAECSGNHFGDACDFDPQSDGRTIYGKNEVYEMDYSKPAGKQWLRTRNTWNRTGAPTDPRQKGNNSVKVRYKNGTRFLYSYDQNDVAINIYKFSGGITERCLSIPDEQISTSYVDKNCDVWALEDNGKRIMVQRCTGVVNGVPTYGPRELFSAAPEMFVRVMRLLYDPDRDIMFLAGGTPELKAMGYGHPGPVIAKYSQWKTTAVKLDWQIAIPYRHDELPALDRIVPEAWDFAGDRLYIAYVMYDVSPRYDAPWNDSPGPVHVFDFRDGKLLGKLMAGPEVHHQSGSIDLFRGISAFQKADGTHMLLVEEIWKNKNLLYIYKPGGTTTESPKMKLSELAAALTAVETKIKKIKAEVIALKAATTNVDLPADAQAALGRLVAEAQAVDDLNADA
jgi:hypothetical protein